MQQSATRMPFAKPDVEGVVRRAKARDEKSWKHRHKRDGHKLKKPAQYNLKDFTNDFDTAA